MVVALIVVALVVDKRCRGGALVVVALVAGKIYLGVLFVVRSWWLLWLRANEVVLLNLIVALS